MHEIRLTRDEQPIPGTVLYIGPFGTKALQDGTSFDFDWLYTEVVSATIREAGMKPVRADSVYGPASVLDAVWRAIQQAEAVVCDFSCRAPNVAMEYMAAKLIGKRMVYLSQSAEDIPSDIRGLRHIPYSNSYADMSHMRDELRVQLKAVCEEPVQEMALIPMATGGTVPARAQVVSVSREFVVVRGDDGAHGVLGGEDVDWARIVPDMTRLYNVGDRLDGAFEMSPSGGAKYTLLTGRPNPWQELATTHPVGRAFTGTVHSVREAGVFVRVAGPLNGLVPRSALPPGFHAVPGARLQVAVTEIEARRRRITLHLDGPAPQGTSPAAPQGRTDSGPALAVGDRLEGEVVKVAPEGQGGYLLLSVEGRRRPVFLHCSAMTAELRRDLNAGGVDRGEVLDVEITHIDPERDRISVRDIADLDDQEPTTST